MILLLIESRGDLAVTQHQKRVVLFTITRGSVTVRGSHNQGWHQGSHHQGWHRGCITKGRTEVAPPRMALGSHNQGWHWARTIQGSHWGRTTKGRTGVASPRVAPGSHHQEWHRGRTTKGRTGATPPRVTDTQGSCNSRRRISCTFRGPLRWIKPNKSLIIPHFCMKFPRGPHNPWFTVLKERCWRWPKL